MDDIARLEQAFQATAMHMQNQAKGEDTVIFIGATRSGKSTLINYILGNKLVGEKIDSYKPVALKKADDNSPGPQIGIGPTSETAIPTRWISPKLPCLAIWDVPGFDDNRGVIQDINNAFYIYHLFKKIKSAKIVLVTDFNDIINDNIRSILIVLKAVENLLKDDMRNCFPGIAIIFSKVPNIICEQQVDKNLINEILNDKLLSNPAIDVSETAKDLIRYLINHNQHFGFFKIPNIGEVSDTTIDDGIIDAVHSIRSIDQSVLQRISPSIANTSKTYLFQVRGQLAAFRLINELQAVVANFIDRKIGDFQNKQHINVTEDEVVHVLSELVVIRDTVQNCISFRSPTLCDKIDFFKIIDPSISNFISQHNLYQRAYCMEFIDRILDVNESQIFLDSFQSILSSARERIHQIHCWGHSTLGGLRQRKEAEAQAMRETERQQEELRQLQARIEEERRIQAQLEEQRRIDAQRHEQEQRRNGRSGNFFRKTFGW